jgi:tRNA 2-(methylsulfanyl)-N6-isopentenyladenosine37 hydroxylase
MFELRYTTPPQWAATVVAAIDEFLPDHASAEYKASGMAMSMALHYKDKPPVVSVMIDLAIEELAHFREVVKIMEHRGLCLQKDEKDPYVNGIRNLMRKGTDLYFLDRLLTGAVIEARGAERFAMVANAVKNDSLRSFYQRIARSEDKHYTLFLDLAASYFDDTTIQARLDELLDAEAKLVAGLPLRPRLH